MGGYEVDVTPGWSVIPQHWTISFIHEIIKLEKELDHPICGYPTKAGAPCRSFPKEVERESIEDIGRCSVHKQSALPRSSTPVEIRKSEILVDKERWLATNPLFQSLSSHAHDLFSSCNPCDMRNTCTKFKANSSCVIEKEMFDDIIGGLLIDNLLDTTIDHMMAFDLTMKFIQLIKTYLYEKQYGMKMSLQDGITNLRSRLSTQIMQLAGKLAIDRKSRLVIKQGGASTLATQDLSRILSGMDDSVSIKSVTATEIRRGPPIPQDVAFLDVDGNEIEQGDMAVDA